MERAQLQEIQILNLHDPLDCTCKTPDLADKLKRKRGAVE
jgi:hypothetical protein